MSGKDSFGRVVYDCLDENLTTWENTRTFPMCTGRFKMDDVMAVEELRQSVRALARSERYNNGDKILGSISRSALLVYMNMPPVTFQQRVQRRQLLSCILDADEKNIDPVTGEDLGKNGPTTEKVKEWKAAIQGKRYVRKHTFAIDESDAKVLRSILESWTLRYHGENNLPGIDARIGKLLARLNKF